MGEINMNYKNRKIIEIAQRLGYNTVKEFATFLRTYKTTITTNQNGKELISITLV